MSTIKLYRHALSGHAHRAEALLSILGLDFELVNIDLANGEHKKEEYLKINAFGQVPALKDGDSIISDSNGILVYLAKKYDASKTWLPENPEAAAEIQKFLSVAAGKIAFGPAAARLVNVFGAGLDHQNAIDISHAILAEFDKHLSGQNWLVGNSPTIADIANYAYIAHAPEGDVSLEAYPHISAWLGRIEKLHGFVPMQSTAVGLAV